MFTSATVKICHNDDNLRGLDPYPELEQKLWNEISDSISFDQHWKASSRKLVIGSDSNKDQREHEHSQKRSVLSVLAQQ